jgi:hypothetical protein
LVRAVERQNERIIDIGNRHQEILERLENMTTEIHRKTLL